MRRFLSNSWFQLGCRLLLGGLFLWAAVPKIAQPAEFAVAIDNYHFLPSVLVNLWAIVLPWVELVVGVLLIAGPHLRFLPATTTEASALLSSLMYLSFIIALSAALARDLDIGCGCFDPKGTDSIDVWYLFRDGAMLLASLIVLLFRTPRRLESSD